MTHGARALQPIGFRFRFMPRKVPGLSANPLGFRGGGGAAVQERETEAFLQSRRPPPSHLVVYSFFFMRIHRFLFVEDMAAHFASVKMRLPEKVIGPELFLITVV